jgi:hypothetical protein
MRTYKARRQYLKNVRNHPINANFQNDNMKKIKLAANRMIVILITTSLTGCIGYTLKTPDPYTRSGDKTTREWCGITLWALILPIPLMLPVCKMYKDQKFNSDFYACGPLMFLGPLVHSYKGNALCGKFPG